MTALLLSLALLNVLLIVFLVISWRVLTTRLDVLQQRVRDLEQGQMTVKGTATGGEPADTDSEDGLEWK